MIYPEYITGELILIVTAILIAYPLSKLNIRLLTYRSLFYSVVVIVLSGSIYCLHNPEYIWNAVSLLRTYFGRTSIWINRSYEYKENIESCYYILIFGIYFVFLISCAHKHKHKEMARYRNAGSFIMFVGLIITLIIFNYIFYTKTGYDASLIGRRFRSLFNSEIGIIFLDFMMLIVARDAGKLFRVLATSRSN